MPTKKFELTSDCGKETVAVYKVSTDEFLRLEQSKVKAPYAKKSVCYKKNKDNSINTVTSEDVTQRYEEKIKDKLDLP